MDSRPLAATSPDRARPPTVSDRGPTDPRFGLVLLLTVAAAGAVAAGAALLAQKVLRRSLLDELAGLGYAADELGAFEPAVDQLVLAGTQAALAVVAGALLGLTVPRAGRAVALGTGAALGWAGLVWLVTTGAAVDVPWPGGVPAHGRALDVLGPAVMVLSVAAGTAVARRHGRVPIRTSCSRLATIVVLGIVLVGSALTAALLVWSATLGWGDGAAVLSGGAVPWLPALVALAWSAAGRHRLVPSTAACGVLLLAGAMAWGATGSVSTAYASGEWSALATVMAAGLTAVVTVWLAASRRAVCDALGGLVE